MKKYICKDCNNKFNILKNNDTNIKTKSLLVKQLYQLCPFCNSTNYHHTKEYEFIFTRKKKFNKLRNKE